MAMEMDTPLPEVSDRVEELEQTLKTLREDSEVAHVLLGLAGVLAELRSVEETLEMAVRVVPELLGADRCYAVTRIGGGRKFTIQAHSGLDEETLRHLATRAQEENGLPLLCEALTERAPLLIGDAAADSRVPREAHELRPLGAYIGLPLVRWGEEFGGLAVEFDRQRSFGSKDLALARGIARQVGQALVNARRFNLLSGLRDFGQAVAPKLSMPAVIAEVSEGARELLRADAAALYFLDAAHEVLVAPPGTLMLLPQHGRDYARLSIQDDPWMPLLRGRPVVVPDFIQAPDPEDRWSAVAAPLTNERHELTGAVLAFFKRALTLAPDEAEALNVLAGYAAMSVENAKRYERQRRVAMSLQQGLLLTDLPTLPQCAVGAVYDAASGEAEIGGDFYDLFDLPDGRYALVVGDVSGKGAEAAARTAMVKYMLRAFAIRNPAPSSVLFHLNNALSHDLEDERFATAVYGVLDPKRGRCTFGLAGHPPPLIYRHRQETIETIELQGAILGAFEDQQYQQETYELTHGDVFVAFTDGLIEARAESGEFYGRRPIEAALRKHAHLAPPDLAQKLLDEVTSFGDLTDDTVVFALRCGG